MKRFIVRRLRLEQVDPIPSRTTPCSWAAVSTSTRSTFWSWWSAFEKEYG